MLNEFFLTVIKVVAFAPKHPNHEFTRLICKVVGANLMRAYVSQSLLFLKI